MKIHQIVIFINKFVDVSASAAAFIEMIVYS